jgi:DNA-binding IclR family transcriptional regulator
MPSAEPPGGLSGQVLGILDRLGGTATMGDLSRQTNAPASRLRRILHELQTEGWVRRTGERAGTRYHLARRPTDNAEKV